MYRLYDASANQLIGTLTAQQLEFLIEHLEEESADDRDYYVNRDTLDLFESAGADSELIGMLRTAMGQRDDMDIRWETTPS